jgi:hypothetical protein
MVYFTTPPVYDFAALNIRMLGKILIGKDMAGSHRGQISVYACKE